ncbi:MAG: hypothetical protein MUP14_10110 [Dehalococcoidia bacterium]|nr:hypothetical protein [Dehalococcoidia bacterium]
MKRVMAGALTAALATGLAVLGLWAMGGQESARAQGTVNFDIDPEISGNSANILGTVEDCVRVDVPSPAFDGVSDYVIDIVVTGHTQAPTAYDASLVYDSSKVHIAAPGTNPLIKLPGATDSSDALPDSDGTYVANAAYLAGSGTAGNGAIVRVGLDIGGSGVVAFTLNGPPLTAYQSGAGSHTITAGSGILAINQDCPLKWTQVNEDGFGDPNNVGTTPIEVFEGDLYAGTVNFVTGGEIWMGFEVMDGSMGWTQVNIDGFGDSANVGACTGIIFQNMLYVGTWKLAGGGESWRTSDGENWTQVNADGFGDPNNLWAYPSAVLNGYLYTGTENYVTGGEVWRSSDGTTWTQVNADGFGDPNNVWAHGLIGFEGNIYAVTQNDTIGAQVWSSPDGTTWTQVNADGFGDPNNVGIHPIWASSGSLYAGTDNYVTGTEVWRFPEDIATWIQVNVDGFGDPSNFALGGSGKTTGCGCNCNNTVGTWNDVTGGEVWKLSGDSTWTQLNLDGFGDPNNYVVFVSGVCFGGTMYVGTGNDSTGGEIWRRSPPVGGIAELPVDSSDSPGRASEGGGASPPYAAIAGLAAAAAAVALAAGGWYARRRLS